MKKPLLLSLSLLLGLTISAQEVQWAKLITSAARDGIWDTQISPTGDLLVLGFFEADLELDGEILQHEDNQDFFLVDYTTAGELQWVIPFTGQNFDRGDCLTFDEDGNIFLGAVFTESIQVPGGTISGNDVADVLLMAFQPDGDLGWEYHFGGSSHDYCYGVAVEGNELLAVGHFNETVDFGFGDVTSEGQQDMWLMSLKTTNGQPNWVKTFGGDLQDRLYSVVKDPDGNIIVCGYFSGTLEIGSQTLEAESGSDVFLAKLDASGNPIWALAGNSPQSNTEGRDLLCDSEGNIYLSGYYREKVDFNGNLLTGGTSLESFLAAFDPEGNWKWGKTTVTDAGSYGALLTLVEDTYLYQASTISNGTLYDGTVVSNLNENGVMVTGFDLDGNVLNYLLHDGPMDDYALPIGNDGHDIYYGGGFVDEIQVGDELFDGLGDQDVFIARTNPMPTNAVVQPNIPLSELAQVRLDVAARRLHVDVRHPAVQTAALYDLQGRLLTQQVAGPHLTFDLTAYPSMPVVLQLSGDGVIGGQVFLLR